MHCCMTAVSAEGSEQLVLRTTEINSEGNGRKRRAIELKNIRSSGTINLRERQFSERTQTTKNAAINVQPMTLLLGIG